MIEKLEVHRYTLKPRGAKTAARPGALLRVTFSDLESPGVSDLFPWTEFGDPALETWIGELKTAHRSEAGVPVTSDLISKSSLPALSPTLQTALQAARDEAVAVTEKRPLVNGSIVNHWLATDPLDLAIYDVMEARRSTSPAIKIKIGGNPPREEAAALARLQSHWGIRLRLDANERWTRDELLLFLEALPIRIRESIEFIEDPFPFDMRAWSEFHHQTGVDVAYDRGARDRDLAPASGGGKTVTGTPSILAEIFDSGAAQVLIHKPAWQRDERAIFARERGVQVVVTSILGHPVGNLWAASKAVQLAPDGVHGCRSHVAYKEEDASIALVKSKQVRGSRVVGVGVGLGLQSKWWNRMKWETIS